MNTQIFEDQTASNSTLFKTNWLMSPMFDSKEQRPMTDKFFTSILYWILLLL